MLRLPSKLQLCAALLIAGLFSDVTSRRGWERIWRAMALWWGGLSEGSRVTEEVARRRLEVCHGCPIFYRPLGTCGTPLVWELREQGCWCNMQAKSRFQDATCWLDETLGKDAPYGWKRYAA